jgi:hypothetical protein
MGFKRVKQILDDAITTWQNAPGNDNPADLSGHGPSFAWATKANLLAAVGHGRRLIQTDVIGNHKGSQANLIIDIRTGFPGAGRMPLGGPYIPNDQIQEIEDWIDAGCPD